MSVITEPPAAGTPPAGHQVTDWRAALPENLRAEKVFESIKGKDWSEAGPSLAQQFVHAQRMIGADKVVLPTDKSTPEEIAAYRKKIGVPDKFEEYTFGKLPDGMKEDQIDKSRFDTWRKEMHEAGVPKAQAERLIGKFLSEEYSYNKTNADSQAKAIKDNEQAIKTEYGDKYDENVNFARWTATKFGDDGLLEVLDKTGLGSHPAVVRLFAKIGRSMAEDGPRGGGSSRGGSGDPSTMTPEVAQMALAEFERSSDNQKVLFNKNDPNHTHLVSQRSKLYAAAFPTENKN